MDALSKLNPQQHQAVTAPPGPTLVLAGPGSGKTRVLTQRIAYLIQHLGVAPYHILAVTFTNKAAKEMKDRVEALLGGNLRGLTIGTFHSICARWLRREAQHLPVTGDFVIFDSADQEALIKQAVQELNLDDKKFKPASLLAKISNAKNELVGPEEYPAPTYAAEITRRVYQRYQALLAANNAMDFDDLLGSVVELFRAQPEVLAKYQRAFEHVLVDEFQDTNTVQYTLLRQLTATRRNLYAVGDPDQCLPAGTLVETPTGPRAIETLQPGQPVIAAGGRGAAMTTAITHVAQRPFSGSLVSVRTRRGYVFRATPNHIVFARLGVSKQVHYVCLMRRQGLGYRIGIVTGARSDGESPELQLGLRVRSNQEVCDGVWVLRVCGSREEAGYWEAYFAFQYGIPTTVFHVRGRRMSLTQAAIDRLYQAIDTVERAEQLLTDLGMDARFPHYVPRARLHRQAVNLRYFGDQRRSAATPWNAHRVDVWSDDPDLKRRLMARGYAVRSGKGRGWRVGFSRRQYDEAHALARELSETAGEGGLSLVTGAFLVAAKAPLPARRFSVMPASHLHPSMIVAIAHRGQIIEDEIVEVTREPYHGQVYDLEVADVHNYLAGGVVVHNSIYRWRGADYRNVRKFQDDFRDAQLILLEENYRSTQVILDAAMAVIDKHPGRTRKQLFTARQGGTQIFAFEAYNEEDEGRFIVDTIAQLTAEGRYQPGDVAVMYRTNALSRAVEEAFIRANLPYKLVGAQRFYGRKEIKDLLAYLRLVHNPADSVSLLRVINVPTRGIGAKTLEVLQETARAANLSPTEVVRDLGEAGPKSLFARSFGNKAAAALANFGLMLNHWIAARGELSVGQLMDAILERAGYRDFLLDGTEEGDERWANVLELRGVAQEHGDATLSEFLEQVALVSDQDTVAEEGKAPILLTLHAAKGLEFPVVFIVGLDEGVLPHQRSFEDPEAMHEERRLMYVGMTRAKDRLYLLRAFRRSAYGDSSVTEPSRFLFDIPDRLLGGQKPQPQIRQSEAYRRATTWETPARGAGQAHNLSRGPAQGGAAPPRPPARYRTGQRVKHASFGEGIVIDSRGGGEEEEVTIAFEAVGIKRLVASVANLQLLKG